MKTFCDECVHKDDRTGECQQPSRAWLTGGNCHQKQKPPKGMIENPMRQYSLNEPEFIDENIGL